MFSGAIPQHTVQTTDKSFQALGLSDPILRTLGSIGFEHPTPIQAEVIPPALAGNDIIGLARTGSGKTGAFSLPMAEKLFHGRGVRGLILCPTREIALQTKAFLEVFGKEHELDTACLIGGVRLHPQIKALRNRPDIIVATPGRLVDHMERGNVRLNNIEILVLDEADHMLDLGFLPQINRILENVPKKRQTMMFSATMPGDIERLTARYMNEPLRIDMTPKRGAASGIQHRLYLVEPDDMKPALMSLLHEEHVSTLVFLRRKIDAEWACRQLQQEGFKAERIHSDLSQQQRVAALKGLREGKHRILLATDIAARGIDIPIIEHIVNYGPPDTVEDYIHRSGRTARGSNEGVVSTIATWLDKEMIRHIERALGKEITRHSVGGVEAYEERKTRVKGRKIRRRRLL